jgi:hypothetical protein
MTDEAELVQEWTNAFIEIAKRGIDPASLADAMLTTAGLLVAQHRGNQAAILQMMAGLNFLTRRETSPEPTPGDVLH